MKTAIATEVYGNLSHNKDLSATQRKKWSCFAGFKDASAFLRAGFFFLLITVHKKASKAP